MASTADYWVGTTIAEGAFGTVVYGTHKLSKLHVAIKCVAKASMAKQPSTAVQLVNEQKILKRLSSSSNNTEDDAAAAADDDDDDGGSKPFIKLYASFHDAHCVYLVTELCCGGTLQDVLLAMMMSEHHGQDDNTKSCCWRAHYGLQILQAVSALHQVGILHCDLKPQNVLLTERGRIKLADFGSAIDLRGGVLGPRQQEQQESSTKSPVVVPRGSPGFAAPELLQQQSKNVTAAADLWSVGCLFFALWTGSSPFEDSGSEALTVQRSQEYCALVDETARTAFLFGDDATPKDADNGGTTKDKETMSTTRKQRATLVPAPWKLLIASLLRPTPSERAGMADTDQKINSTEEKDGTSLYPSLQQLDVWKDVDTNTVPALLPPVPQWWTEQQQDEKDNKKLKDGATGWSAFLV